MILKLNFVGYILNWSDFHLNPKRDYLTCINLIYYLKIPLNKCFDLFYFPINNVKKIINYGVKKSQGSISN